MEELVRIISLLLLLSVVRTLLGGSRGRGKQARGGGPAPEPQGEERPRRVRPPTPFPLPGGPVLLPEWFPGEEEENGKAGRKAEVPAAPGLSPRAEPVAARGPGEEGVSQEWTDVAGRELEYGPEAPPTGRVGHLLPETLVAEDMARAVVFSTLLGRPRGLAPYRPPFFGR